MTKLCDSRPAQSHGVGVGYFTRRPDTRLPDTPPFVIRISSLFRHSSFVIRHSEPVLLDLAIQCSLADTQKLRRLLEYVLDEAGREGDPYHQSKLRRVLLRLLKRVEPETWYDLMYLPFLARNTYLASLDERSIDEHMIARARNANLAPMEDLQRMAWNLAKWIRQRLYLLGIVDLGYDERERPVALRLTRVGARLFGLLGEFDGAGGKMGVGSLVVTPDFEVVRASTLPIVTRSPSLTRLPTRDCRSRRTSAPITTSSPITTPGPMNAPRPTIGFTPISALG